MFLTRWPEIHVAQAAKDEVIMQNEIYVIVAINADYGEEVAVFTDREEAGNWYKKLKAKGISVGVHTVELDSAKDLIVTFE